MAADCSGPALLVPQSPEVGPRGKRGSALRLALVHPVVGGSMRWLRMSCGGSSAVARRVILPVHAEPSRLPVPDGSAVGLRMVVTWWWTAEYMEIPSGLPGCWRRADIPETDCRSELQATVARVEPMVAGRDLCLGNLGISARWFRRFPVELQSSLSRDGRRRKLGRQRTGVAVAAAQLFG